MVNRIWEGGGRQTAKYEKLKEVREFGTRQKQKTIAGGEIGRAKAHKGWRILATHRP